LASKDSLPRPDGPKLRELVPTQIHRAIYRVLYERRTDPPTMQETQEAVRAELGDEAADQVHFSKRLRELRDHFDIQTERDGARYEYRLARRRDLSKPDAKINKRLRARVLRHQRCEMCGRTPREDAVRLHADHKLPREWGGPTEEWNLQALCSECNEGKKAYYATFDSVAPQIMAAVRHDSVYLRIGELLKAFDDEGMTTPDEVLEFVAEAKGRQRYWEKRMRELRHIGWTFEPRMHDEGGVRKTEWKLGKWAPWPPEGPGAAIRRVTRSEIRPLTTLGARGRRTPPGRSQPRSPRT
jgi:5-methylcytosine-specific restriction endonuclease McrA